MVRFLSSTTALVFCFMGLLPLGCDRTSSGTASRDTATGRSGSTPPAEQGVDRPTADGSGSAATNRGDDATTGQEQPAVDTPPSKGQPGGVPRDVPAAVEMPRVLMSQADEATCLLRVNDIFPAAEWMDLEGQSLPLTQLLGDRLSVIFFWTVGDTDDDREQLQARGYLQDLDYDFADQFHDQGVKVVAIEVGNTAEDVRRQVEEADVNFSVVLDADGAFGQIATGRLPRVYLLDADGKILWFDIEYSLSTRRDLMHAIQYSLAQ